MVWTPISGPLPDCRRRRPVAASSQPVVWALVPVRPVAGPAPSVVWEFPGSAMRCAALLCVTLLLPYTA
eukprot:2517317-Pyramimonas_sp.AAC.1